MTFVIKVRGARGEMRTDYECPVHGRYTATVQRDEKGDPPETAQCPHLGDPGSDIDDFPCTEMAELRICAPLTRVNPIEAVKGKSQKPERKTWTDTRNIAEGQPVYEWKEERAKVWEEKRKQDVYNYAREHNERVIGGD